MNKTLLSVVVFWLWAMPLAAQQTVLTFATVERPPFSFVDDGEVTGFSADLIRAIGQQAGATITFDVKSSFPEMLNAVETGAVDGAIANISITGAREAIFDFSQPIFRSGLQIMVPFEGGQTGIWRAVLNRDLGLSILLALGALLGMGMLMWAFERRKQPYFERSAGQAMFPAFWWALNLVVNGGFEQNEPRTPMGRVLAVLMVISSLFVVSFFVATITASMTVQALNESIESINDLDGRVVGTTLGSTASAFLTERDIAHRRYADFEELIENFEDGVLDAVFFDGPLLAYYISTDGARSARLIERVFRPENYGIVLPTGSPLREQINVILLSLNEAGDYNRLVDQWFDSGG